MHVLSNFLNKIERMLNEPFDEDRGISDPLVKNSVNSSMFLPNCGVGRVCV